MRPNSDQTRYQALFRGQGHSAVGEAYRSLWIVWDKDRRPLFVTPDAGRLVLHRGPGHGIKRTGRYVRLQFDANGGSAAQPANG